MLLILDTLQSEGIIPVDLRSPLVITTGMLLIFLDVNVYSRRYWAAGVPAGTAAAQQRKKKHRSQFMRSVYCATSDSNPASSMLSCTAGSSQGASLAFASSIELIANPTMSVAYAAHVEASLCYESYKFLADSLAYSQADYGGDIDLQVSCLQVYLLLLPACVQVTCVVQPRSGSRSDSSSSFSSV
jgi:hypothetical protein